MCLWFFLMWRSKGGKNPFVFFFLKISLVLCILFPFARTYYKDYWGVGRDSQSASIFYWMCREVIKMPVIKIWNIVQLTILSIIWSIICILYSWYCGYWLKWWFSYLFTSGNSHSIKCGIFIIVILTTCVTYHWVLSKTWIFKVTRI